HGEGLGVGGGQVFDEQELQVALEGLTEEEAEELLRERGLVDDGGNLVDF
ncbi:unnamed protein product, partial [Discosporangium mesarthrocarpum]